MNELLIGEYIEKEDAEKANNRTLILLLEEIGKLKRNESLTGALCAIIISFITLIYSIIWTPGAKAYEQFFSGFIKAISAGCLVLGIILIFYTWVKSSQSNSGSHM